MVEIIEFYPNQGRHWYNHFNWTDWSGWECMYTSSQLKDIVITRSFSKELAGDTSGSIVTLIPYTVPDGYELVDCIDVWTSGIATSSSFQGFSENNVQVYSYVLRAASGTLFAKLLFRKKF